MPFGGPGLGRHYPVTTAYWRGIRSLSRFFPGHLRRACDWHRTNSSDVSSSWKRVTCPDCLAYIESLLRLLK